MSTRGYHRKSRYGCAQCKRRHIKCDEVKPSCGNCSITRRPCSFLSTSTSIFARLDSGLQSGPARSSPPSSSPTNSCSSSSATSNPTRPEHGQPSVSPAVEVPPANLLQLELLHHFTNGSLEFPAASLRSKEITPSKIVQEALGCDYLMNEILAFSARYLATARPDKCALYLHQAKQFQTHAVAAFSQQIEIVLENRFRVLLFSWILGTHLLSDVAPLTDRQNTLDRFLQYIHLYRGVRAATAGAWESLLETEHGHSLQDGAAVAGRVCNGGRTSLLELLIQESLGMHDNEKNASQEALAKIQWVISAYEEAGPEAVVFDCFSMAFSWPLVIAPEFVGLLLKKRPEALLVLAHFAVLLHWCRRHWIFTRVGCCLFDSIALHLGQGWERWLEWPRQMVDSDG